MIHRISTLLLLFVSLVAWGQSDPVLFTVGDTPVNVSEFQYIYSKTNGEKADFSKESLEEYLDLYVKFKLKVQKARELQYDTIKSLQSELNGYRRQLADSYLIDKEVKDKLVKEAYNRTLKDRNISHILVKIKGVQTPADTLKAYRAISDIKKKLDGGESFERIAQKFSEDQYTKARGGTLGWITAILPNGFYGLESAAYNTSVGKYSDVARSNLGYHIVKVNEERRARGTVEVAHILVRKAAKGQVDTSKQVIDKAYAELKAGAGFEATVKKYSQDKKTKGKGGYIGFFGIGVNEASFEDAAFGLAKNGDYSAPIQTSIGWHIIRRVSKPEIGTYQVEKNRIQVKVEQDSRYQEARTSMIRKIMMENKFTINEDVLKKFLNSLDDSFTTYKWRAPKKSDETLFTFDGGFEYPLGGFTDYLLRQARERTKARSRKGNSVAERVEPAVRNLLEKFAGEKALDLEKKQLSDKYPDFRSLMREYEEGIMLFEATKDIVWDKASKDTVGLQNFYNKNRGNYMFGQRADITTYTIKSASSKIIDKARKCAKKKPSDYVISKLDKNGSFISADTKTFEKGKTRNDALEALKWKKGSMTANVINDDNSTSFSKVEKVLPGKQKSLKEARGYVIADYQDQLESEWVESLRKEYPVKINQNVLNSMVR